MAFVPNCEHDIFVSYAHVDDQPMPSAEEGWVTTLVKGLKTKLAQKLGRSDAYDLWMDHELSPHVQVTSQIMDKLQKTATLIVVLSPGYVASEWCQREKEAFLNFVKERVHAGSRVFVVEREMLEEGLRPTEFEELIGYRFWVTDREGKPPRVLGVPKPDPDDKRYYDLITDLSYDLANELKRLKTVAENPDAHPPLPDRPIVYLAEVTDDLELQRDEVKRYLDQHGLRILPENLYPREPIQFQEAAEKDLAECELFVQLLSGLLGKKPPGRSETYARLQYDYAEQAGKPILQWRSRELDLSRIINEDHRAFLELETVMAIGMEDFKKRVVQQAFYKPPPPSQRPDNILLFVNRDSTDQEIAKEVGDILVRNGAGYVLPLESGTPTEIREDLERNLLECDGVIIVYGRITVKWVREQLYQCRKIIARRESPLKALAIFEGPPEQKDNLNLELPAMQIINCRRYLNEAVIKSFVGSL